MSFTLKSLFSITILLSLLACGTPSHAMDSTLDLTGEERTYLEKKRQLTIVCDPDWPPYEYIAENGEYEGLSIDYHNLLARRIGVPIVPIITKSWLESLYIVQAGECDLVSAINKTPRRNRYLNFTTPFIELPIVIVGKSDCKKTRLEEFDGHTFAVLRGYKAEEDLRRDYPGIKHFKVNTTQEALDAVAQGKAFATITTALEATHFVRVNNLDNLAVLGGTPYVNRPGFGVQKSDTLLLSIMQKAVDSLSAADKSTIERKWLSAEKKDSWIKIKYVIPLSIAAILIAAFACWFTGIFPKLKQ